MENDIHSNLYFVVLPIHTLALLLAVFGNISTIIIIIRTPRLHTPSCSLMLVLALSDLLFSLVWNIVPLSAVNENVRQSLRSSWLCIFIGVTWQSTITVLAFLHGVVALDRYFFIVHPMKYQLYVTIKRSLLLAGVIYLIAGLLPGFLLICGKKYVYSAPAMTCVGPSYWSILFLTLIFLPSLIVTLFSYQRIWKLCVKAIKHDIIGSSRILSPSLLIVCPQNKKTSGFQQSSQAMPTLRDDVNLSSKINVNPKPETVVLSRKLMESPRERNGLTSCTTIDGTTYSIFHEGNGKTAKNVFQGQTFVKLERSLNSPFNMLEKSTHGKKSDAFDEDYARLNVGITACSGDCVPSSSTVTPLPVIVTTVTSPHREGPYTGTDSRQAQRDINVSSPVSISCINNADHSVRSMLLQWAGIVNPVISWMLMQDWSVDVDSKDLRPHGNFLSLPITFTETQQNDQKRDFFASGRKRRLRSCLMMILPVFGMMVYFLPLVSGVLYWEYRPNSHSDFSVVVCHLCYAMAPSTVSLILSMSNKPYRRALIRKMCCCVARRT